MSRKYKPSILFVFSIVATIGITNYSASFANSIHTHSINYTEQRVERQSAPLFNDLGHYHFHVSTNSSLAQRYFDQGLILAYGFNHAEAARSFREAIHLDPACAMCYWGLAYVLGPNINATMEDESVPTAYTAIQQAVALSHNATEREQAYITAMATRYVAEPVEDRAELDLAYANAMRDVAQQYPEDLDAQTIFVEALMDTMPWDYWLEDGSPKPETIEMMHTLESVLDRNPDHAGALHLYIHVVEKKRPELGIEAADRLRDLVPGAGHLVHMPSHIYISTTHLMEIAVEVLAGQIAA
jgi:tetratricopeptide (TPR) repeat protein